MSTSSLAAGSLFQFPSELLVLIYKSVDMFSTLSTFSRTCRRMHRIWQANTDVICKAVQVRAIECADQVIALVDSQIDQGLHFEGVAKPSEYDRTIRALLNASYAEVFLNSFEGQQIGTLFSNHDRFNLTQIERVDFLRALYRLFTAKIDIECRPMKHLIDACGALTHWEFMQLLEVMDWIMDHCDLGSTYRRMIDVHLSTQKPAEWCDIAEFLQLIDIVTISMDEFTTRKQRQPYGRFLFPSVFQVSTPQENPQIKTLWTETKRAIIMRANYVKLT